MLQRLVGLCVLCALVWSCGRIPTDPNELTGANSDDLVYVDESWGFQISRPTPDWGLSVQTSIQQRYNNGKPVVDVRIASPYLDFFNTNFRRELHLEPRALAKGTTLDDMATAFEAQELMQIFDGYRIVGDKVRLALDGGEAIEWQFRNAGLGASESRIYPGTQFLAAVAIHNDEGYYMIGNGNSEGFPIVEYEKIVASLRFASR